ncbi:unnamed protein product [Rhizophagus irregularis]|uniref:Uncharacterized protein n=1 Tax=Rhizophagus irregularis TaxID=588596 RepID=A0A2N1NSB5_9GLOM|nr:hypothetical protein RhiirC2_844881 [Rhizophagus irregularis]CAB4374068.1 unnamed protein product [Rhizophagus irregularis]CAB5374245.1 unnamed protein product [Rhizophagus irregularis]
MEGDLEREAESSHSLVGFKEKSTRVQEKSPLSQDTIQERLPLYEALAREKSPYKSVTQEKSSSVARGKSSFYTDYTIQGKPAYKGSVREKATLYKTTAQKYGYSFVSTIMEYIRPFTKLFGYFWNNFAPLRWFVYTFLTFCSVPTAIFIGWAVLCFAGIIALAGVGITIAEGFFLFLGMSVFLPVAIILCIIAFVTVVFLTLAWIGMRSSVTVYGYFNGPSNVEVEEAEYTKRSIDEKNKFDL